jgi:hypothetical protein
VARWAQAAGEIESAVVGDSLSPRNDSLGHAPILRMTSSQYKAITAKPLMAALAQAIATMAESHDT